MYDMLYNAQWPLLLGANRHNGPLTRLRETIQSSLTALNESFHLVSALAYKTDLDGLSKFFLSFAVSIESHLASCVQTKWIPIHIHANDLDANDLAGLLPGLSL